MRKWCYILFTQNCLLVQLTPCGIILGKDFFPYTGGSRTFKWGKFPEIMAHFADLSEKKSYDNISTGYAMESVTIKYDDEKNRYD